MSRSQPYRGRLPVHIMQLLDVASRITLFLVGQAGPLSFTFKDRLDNKYRTQIGPDLKCSCSPNRNDQCIHTAYVLLRIFRLSVDNPLIWQAAYVDSQLEDLLAGKHSQVQHRPPRPHFADIREEWSQLPSEMLQRRLEERREGREIQKGGEIAQRMKLGEEAVCPVCQQQMREQMCLSWCRVGCGNNFHLECLKVWARHRSQEGASVNCPMCRSRFPPSFLNELEREERQWARKQSEKLRVSFDCAGCGLKGIPTAPHKCLLCSCYQLCEPCYSSGKHIKHPFVRQDVDGRWRGAQERRSGQLKLKEYIDSKRKQKFNDQMLRKLRKIQEDPAKLFDFVASAYPYVSRYISDHIDPLRKMDFSPADLRCQKCASTKMLFLRRLPCGHFIDHECLKDAILKDKFYCAEDGSQFLKGFQNLRMRQKEVDDKKEQQYLSLAPDTTPSEFSAAHIEEGLGGRELYNFVMRVQEEEPTLTEILSNRGSSERRPDQLRTRITSNIIREQRAPARQLSHPPPPPSLPPPPIKHTPPRPQIRVRNVGVSTKARNDAQRGRPLSRGRGSGKKKEDLQTMIQALIGRKLK